MYKITKIKTKSPAYNAVIERNFFDSLTIEVTTAYLDQFFDIISDHYDCSDEILYMTDIDTKYDEKLLVIDIKRQTIQLRENCWCFLNTINSKRLILRHNFLKYPLISLYTTLNSKPKLLKEILENFYIWMYHPILSSISKIDLNSSEQYVSEIPIGLLQEYGIVTSNIQYAGDCVSK